METRIENDHNETIVGILVEKETYPKKLVLIAHGEFGDKNSLYQPLLAEQLPYSTFRFDFRGHGDSHGQTGYANMAEDVQDLHTVADYFENRGYDIMAVIAHSRGSTAGLKYATTCDKPLSHYVNIAGRYIMNDYGIHMHSPEVQEALNRQGFFEWKTKQNGKTFVIKVTAADLEKIKQWDSSHVSRMPKSTCVLTCHGLKDTVVLPHNAALLSNKISNHTLRLVPDADHDFTGKHEELVQTIVDYFKKHENDSFRKAQAMGQHVSVTIPRWIDVQGVKNFRDIGGWPVKDGSGYIRERVVFRCGHLVNVTEQGINTLKQLNVIAAFDFRSDPEIERQGVMPDIPNLIRYPSAMFTKADYSPAALATRWKGYFEGPYGFPKVYNIILEKGGQQYRKVFLHMLEHHSRRSTKSLIVHCTAGKDRTGIFGMLLLSLCGVDDDIIAHEYALSNLGYWEPEHELEKKAQMLGVTVDDMRMVMSAPYLAMKETIRLTRERYGSIEQYIRDECGLTTEQMEGIRKLMIVPVRFEERQLFQPKM